MNAIKRVPRLLIMFLSIASILNNLLWADQKYFPPSTLSSIMTESYTKHLQSMQEPPLLSVNTVSYRFLYLRTYHRPVALRLQINSDETGTLYIKMTDGLGGYEPGNLVVSKQTNIATVDVENFLNFLDQANFWKLPAKEPPEIPAPGYIVIKADGAQWVVEGNDTQRYHIVERNSPRPGPYRNAALFLLKLAKLKIKANEIY